MKKTFIEILKEGNEGESFRTIIEGLMDDQILSAVEEYADQFKKKETIDPKNVPLIKEVVSQLNIICKTNFNAASKVTYRHINARIKEGFLYDDFRLVINDRCRKWFNDPDMRLYLRPATLFGTKFESYLQEAKRNVPVAKEKTDEDIAKEWEGR